VPWRSSTSCAVPLGSAAEAQCANDLARKLKFLPDPVTEKLEQWLDESLACLHGLLKRLGRRQ